MKRLFSLLTLTLLTAVSWAIETSQVPFADPCVILAGDTYYAYGTHSGNGIEYYYSQDLTNWTYGGLALSKNDTNEDIWFWAPEVFHHNGKYYMFYSGNLHIYVAVADSPKGPFRQKGIYLLTNLIQDEHCIDSHIFQNHDGTLWLFFDRWINGGERIYRCQLSDDTLEPIMGTLRECIHVDTDWEKIWPEVVEGPFVIENEGKYYLSYSANGYECKDYAIGYAESNSLEGPWKKFSGNPILRRTAGQVGIGHHAFFRDKEGKLRIAFHAHKSATEVHPRGLYIGTMKFENGDLLLSDEDIISPRSDAPNGGGDKVDNYAIDWSKAYAPSSRTGACYKIKYTRNPNFIDNAWTLPDYDDTLWKDALGPVGSKGAPLPEGAKAIGTTFPEATKASFDMCFRRTFTLKEDLSNSIVFLSCGHDDAGAIYLDGQLLRAWGQSWDNAQCFRLTPQQASLLKPGKHVLAVKASNLDGDFFFDCGLYGSKKQ